MFGLFDGVTFLPDVREPLTDEQRRVVNWSETLARELVRMANGIDLEELAKRI